MTSANFFRFDLELKFCIVYVFECIISSCIIQSGRRKLNEVVPVESMCFKLMFYKGKPILYLFTLTGFEIVYWVIRLVNGSLLERGERQRVYHTKQCRSHSETILYNKLSVFRHALAKNQICQPNDPYYFFSLARQQVLRVDISRQETRFFVK